MKGKTKCQRPDLTITTNYNKIFIKPSVCNSFIIMNDMEGKIMKTLKRVFSETNSIQAYACGICGTCESACLKACGFTYGGSFSSRRNSKNRSDFNGKIRHSK